MIEVKNHIHQTLLRLEDGKIISFSNQTIATTENGCLFNLQGQKLAWATTDGFETHGGADFKLAGYSLLGPSDSLLATVRGGDAIERALAAAAYVEFILDS